MQKLIVEQALNSLQTLSQNDLNENNKSNETSLVSIYKNGKVSVEALAHGVILLKKAFPRLTDGWFEILEKYLDEEHFDDMKFKHAVNNLIKTCPYPEPTIANVLTYDKKIKIYSHYEIMERHKNSFYPGSTEDVFNKYYVKIKHNNEIRYVLKEDFVEGLFEKA